MPTEIAIPLDNKPGTLAKVTEVLGKAGVNLEGVGYASGARGVLRVVPSDADAALAALKKAKIKAKKPQEVLEVRISDTPGALAVVARKLAKARVNVEAFYVVGADAGQLRCVFAVDKLDKAKAAIGL
jgi:hypothetical protein